MLCNIKPVPFHESDKHIFAKIPGGVRTPGPPLWIRPCFHLGEYFFEGNLNFHNHLLNSVGTSKVGRTLTWTKGPWNSHCRKSYLEDTDAGCDLSQKICSRSGRLQILFDLRLLKVEGICIFCFCLIERRPSASRSSSVSSEF